MAFLLCAWAATFFRAVSLFDDGGHDRCGDADAVVIERNLAKVDAVKEIFIHRPARFFRTGYLAEVLLDDALAKGGRP
jgi:hypothetical protein